MESFRLLLTESTALVSVGLLLDSELFSDMVEFCRMNHSKIELSVVPLSVIPLTFAHVTVVAAINIAVYILVLFNCNVISCI